MCKLFFGSVLMYTYKIKINKNDFDFAYLKEWHY